MLSLPKAHCDLPMTPFSDRRCVVHDVALRPDGSCVLCLRERPGAGLPPAAVGPVAHLIRAKPAPEPNAWWTALIGVLFVLSVSVLVLWYVNPSAIRGVFE